MHNIRSPLQSLNSKLVLLVLIALTSRVVYADLIMSAPPRETAELGNKLYSPLADYLSGLLGEKVVYEYPQNWLQYQRDLRKGVYDIVFDGPHFVSWRVEHLKHDVLLKLPGTLEFVIVSQGDDDEIKTVKDLVGKRVCGIPPPNLATMTVIEQFKNPVRQPVIWGVEGGYMRVFREFGARHCRAAVFRTNFFYKKLTAEDRKGLNVLYKSKPMPNQAISVSQRVSAVDKKKIIRSLTIGPGKQATAGIVRRFSDNKADPFVEANNKEYRDYNELLEGIVFGW